LPPQWRNLLFAFAVAVALCGFVAVHSPNPNFVISTEGGVLAAAVEKSAVCTF
jgi:hypothetical protein